MSAPRGTERYRYRGRLGRGGMGVVFRVWDPLLERDLAMKVFLGPLRDREHAGQDRFVREAELGRRLSHPGIPPVHELGAFDGGRPFFTMPVVEGANFAQVIEKVHGDDASWTLDRALDHLVAACDAVGHAHERGVVHRDLKPSNIMVGPFDETYVMDWGVASRMQDGEASDAKRDDPSPTADGPQTLDGRAIGTPNYMPPEQARGELADLDATADVYALGALLYHLLAGATPYAEARTPTPKGVLARVLSGPPPPLAEVSTAPAALIAVCEKAMARDAADRYPDTRALARDLRRYRERRPVAAVRMSLGQRAALAVRRNRGLVLAVVGAIGLLGTLLAVYTRSLSAERIAAERARGHLVQARTEESSSRRFEEISRALLLGRESAIAQQDFSEAPHMRELWPVHVELVPWLSTWIDIFNVAAQEQVALEEERSRMRAQALPYTDADRAWDLRREIAVKAAEVAQIGPLERARERLRAHASPEEVKLRDLLIQGLDSWAAARRKELAALQTKRVRWEFADPDDSQRHTQLSLMLEVKVGDAAQELTRRVERAKEIAAQSVEGEHAEAWAKCREEIRVAHDGLDVPPQMGLRPLGRDPVTKLFEFAHVASGSVPVRGKDGTLHYEEDACMVLVLLPPQQEFWMGAQRHDRDLPHFDPDAITREGPVRPVRVDAFFMAKHECTIAQWRKLAVEMGIRGGDIGKTHSGHPVTERHPMTSVKLDSAQRWMQRFLLRLPEEHEWEYACRAGTTDPFVTGRDPAALAGYANVMDRAWAKFESVLRVQSDQQAVPAAFDDGYGEDAPVGTYKANAFGLHEMLGNVHEWVATPSFGFQHFGGDAWRIVTPVVGIYRGGAWNAGPRTARATFRVDDQRDRYLMQVGFRAARSIER